MLFLFQLQLFLYTVTENIIGAHKMQCYPIIFSIALCKDFAPKFIAQFFVSTLCASFLYALPRVIALPTIAIAIVVTLSLFRGDSKKISLIFHYRL